MKQITNIPDRPDKKRIVIVGGGFGGLKLASKLDPLYFDVVLLDKNNYHQFQPLLYQVAIAGLEPSSIVYPFRKNFQKKKFIHFRMCEVTQIIPESHLIETNIGSLSYDFLVIACGCETNFFGNNQLQYSTITLKSISDALYARNQILKSFEEAATISDPVELKKRLNFVVVGGGATGVELAGALADMKNFILPKDYPELDFSKMQIHLVDASPRLLIAMSEEASKRAEETLHKRGVALHQSVFVTSYENDILKASNGAVFQTKNVIWVAGVTANVIPGFEAKLYGRGNRLLVNEFCQVNGYKNVFAIGDVACMMTSDYPNGHPQVAQGAIQMGTLLAHNLVRLLENKEMTPFHYVDKGTLATIGRNAAVADLHNLKFGGRIAWWLWLLVHIVTIIGVKNKILVMLDWAWNYVTYDVSLRLLIRPRK